jgi:hypothetical protein
MVGAKLKESHKFYIFCISEFVFRIHSISASFPAQFDSDSASYRSGNGLTNWGWISLSGSHYGRGWPIISLYSLVKQDEGRILLQNMLELLAWIVFAHSILRIWKSSRSWVLLLAMFVFSNTVQAQNPFVLIFRLLSFREKNYLLLHQLISVGLI